MLLVGAVALAIARAARRCRSASSLFMVDHDMTEAVHSFIGRHLADVALGRPGHAADVAAGLAGAGRAGADLRRGGRVGVQPSQTGAPSAPAQPAVRRRPGITVSSFAGPCRPDRRMPPKGWRRGARFPRHADVYRHATSRNGNHGVAQPRSRMGPHFRARHGRAAVRPLPHRQPTGSLRTPAHAGVRRADHAGRGGRRPGGMGYAPARCCPLSTKCH